MRMQLRRWLKLQSLEGLAEARGSISKGAYSHSWLLAGGLSSSYQGPLQQAACVPHKLTAGFLLKVRGKLQCF